jgi:hypothetical protein
MIFILFSLNILNTTALGYAFDIGLSCTHFILELLMFEQKVFNNHNAIWQLFEFGRIQMGFGIVQPGDQLVQQHLIFLERVQHILQPIQFDLVQLDNFVPFRLYDCKPMVDIDRCVGYAQLQNVCAEFQTLLDVDLLFLEIIQEDLVLFDELENLDLVVIVGQILSCCSISFS